MGKPRVFKHNDNRLFIIWTSAFILFPLAQILGMKKIRRFFETMTHIMIILYTPISVWALVKYYQGLEAVLPSGKSLYAYHNTALSIGSHRNVTGATAAVMIALCIYMILMKHKQIKILYIGAITIHFWVLIVSNSRTSFIAAIFLLDEIIAIICMKKLINYSRSVKKGLSLLECIIITVAIVVISTIMFIVLRRIIIELTSNILKNNMYVRSNYTNLSGRKEIWQASVVITLSSTSNSIFGVTPAYVKTQLYDTGLLSIIQPHCHNVLLEVGTGLGVPSMINYAIFLLLLSYRCIRLIMALFQPKRKKSTLWMWPIATLILFLMLYGITEVMIYTTQILLLPVFYILAGWTVAYDRQLNGKISVPLLQKNDHAQRLSTSKS